MKPRHRQATTWAIIRRMASYFRPYRLQVGCSLTLVLLECGLGMAGPLLLQRLIDQALPQRDAEQLLLLSGAMIGVGVLSSGLGVVEITLTNWIGQRVVSDLRLEVYDHAHRQPLEFYSDQGETQIQARLVSDIEGVDRLLTGTAQSALAAATSLIIAVGVMLALSWPLAIFSLVLAFGLSLLNNRFSRQRRVLGKRRQEQLTTLMEHVAQDLSLAGVILGRTLGRTGRQRLHFTEISAQVCATTLRQRFVGTVALAIISTAYAAIPPVIYLLAGSVLPGLSIGTVVVLVILQMRLAAPLQSLLSLSGALQASVAMFERVLDYLDLGTHDVGTATPGALTHGVRLRNLSHRYAGAPRLVLGGVSLDLTPGSCTLIAGGSGSGKSTLGLILSGLTQQCGGSVTTPGGRVLTPAELRAAVTLVPQHTLLLKGSVRDNLCFVRDDVTEQEMEEALALVQLDALIARLPYGLDTSVGRDGYQLSGGERQRLALARALLAPGELLVLDEATSALDNLTAEYLHRALRARCADRILLLIAHRIPLLEPEDRVLVMEGGRVVERGTHAELAGHGGAYTRLLGAQQSAVTHLEGPEVSAGRRRTG